MTRRRPLPKEEVLRRQREHSGRLTVKEVAQIKRHLLDGTSTPRELAAAFSIALQTVRAIQRGDTWAWVTPDHEHLDQLETSPEAASAAEDSLKRLLDANPDLPVQRLVEDIDAVAAKRREADESLDNLKSSP